MKKILLLIGFLFVFAFGYSQTSVLRPRIDAGLLNGQLSTYYLDTSSTAQAKSSKLTISLTDADGGGSGLVINNIFTKVGAFAHKAILSEVTYTPASTGTASPIGVVGKVNLNGNLTASPTSTYPGLGWGVQGQIHVVTGTTINSSTYGVPGAIYAGLRGVLTDAGTSTYTKGALTGLYSEIQITQTNANDQADFNIYGAWIRNQGTASATDIAAGLFIDANFSYPNTFLKGIDINDAVMGIEISATTTGIDFSSSMTQEIIGQNDETIDNASDGVWDFGTADLTTIGRLSALKTTEQLRLSYDATNYLTVTLADDGHTTFVTVDPDGEEADINFNPDGNVGIKTAAPGSALEITGKTTTDDLRIDNLATGDTEVLSPDASGDIVTLSTADIGEIAIQTSSGQVVVSTSGAQNIATGGTFERLDEGTIGYTGRHLHDFTHSDGRLTYTGTNTKHFIIMVHLSIECNETNALIQLQLYKDGALIPLSNDQNDYTAVTTDKGLSIVWLEEFATNEYIELWVTSDQDNDDLTLHNGSMVITQE